MKIVIKNIVLIFALMALAPSSSYAQNKYLLLDSRIIDTTDNARLAVGTVTKEPTNPLFEEELPWEQYSSHLYANMLFDKEEQIYKLWYFSTIYGAPGQEDWSQYVTPGPLAPNEEAMGNLALLYATSTDGLTWDKPALDMYYYNGQPTNIVHWGDHGTGVFKDLQETDPNRRYKLISGRTLPGYLPGDKLDAAFSADGIHWGERFEIATARGDTHNNALWAPDLNKYVAFSRAYPPRTVLRMESEDFINWSEPVEVLRGPPGAETYSMPVFRYANVYIGLPAIFYTDQQSELHGLVTTELAWSPDTEVWYRIDEGSQLIPLGDFGANDYDWGCIFAADDPVVLEDEIRLYYSGQDNWHDWADGTLNLATMRIDGWAGYESLDGSNPAMVTITPFTLPHGDLKITADALGGSVTVTLLDGGENVLLTSNPVTGNVTDYSLSWSGGVPLENYVGQEVHLKFEISQAKLYSYTIPEPGGDLDGDGYIDETDADLITLNWGSEAHPAYDLDGNGFIGLGDAAIIRANWDPNPNVAASIPEPGSLALLTIGSLALLVLRRRCRIR